MPTKKLIEVALPLEDINRESAREKSIRHGHPSTLHLWWARRPLASARAVLWASLVDDPSSHPETFPTEEAQSAERERLFGILRQLVVWENSNDEDLLRVARAEIRKSVGGNPPELLDPFAGGGSIPLEGQRLGLKVHAHDLNPVAVMINKAMIEIPPRFAGQAPVNPEVRRGIGGAAGWVGASGLAEDVRYYGERMKGEAFKRVGHLYPRVETPEGEATVIAWIWARTVKCPNPACGCEMPLINSFVLSRKQGMRIEPQIEADGKTIKYVVSPWKGKAPEALKIAKGKFKCVACGAVASNKYLQEQFAAGKHGQQLVAIVAEGKKTKRNPKRRRLYITPNPQHEAAANVDKPENYPDGAMPDNPRWFSPPLFGMTEYSDLFTNRQLTMLTTFSDLITEAQEEVRRDAQRAGMDDKNALAYAQAVSVYLAFLLSKLLLRSSTISSWDSGYEKIMMLFGRQAIPMVWDFAECNVFSNSSGSLSGSLKNITTCITSLPYNCARSNVEQFDAQSDCGLRNLMISTDPPYYDNIGYADLSDYFYIWLRRSLKDIYPELFRTLLVPKAEELIAAPHRHDGDIDKAKAFFEDGMLETCRQLYRCASDDVPVTIYYAYKQSETESDGQTTSAGWETMLNAILKAGFTITGTWPMRTELVTALKNHVNALASSIVLVCRKRPADAPSTTRRNLIQELERELPPAIKKLQKSNIAPVDMKQAIIGPGMAVFSKYAAVLEANGKPVTVRDALKIINKISDPDDSDFDSETRFCLDLYTQCGFDTLPFGSAQTLATARGIVIEKLANDGMVYARGGDVHLIDREEIEVKVSATPGADWLLTQRLTKALETGGREACAKVLAPVMGAADRAKFLAYRLFSIADRRGWTQEAFAYNSLVTDWAAVLDRARELQKVPTEQLTLALEIEEGK